MLENIKLIKKQIDTDFKIISFIDDAKELYDKLKEQYDNLNKEYSDLSSAFMEIKYYAELMSFYDIKVLPLVYKFRNSENNSIFDNRDKELNSKIEETLKYIKSVIEHLKEKFPKLAIPIIKKLEKMQSEYEENITIGLNKLKNNDSIKLGINNGIVLTTLGTPDMIQKLYLKDLELFFDLYLNDSKKLIQISTKIDEIYENCSQLKDIIITDDSLKKDILDLFDKIKKHYNNYKSQVDNIFKEDALGMLSNLVILLNETLKNLKELEEKTDILYKQKLINDKYILIYEELLKLDVSNINLNTIKNLEKIILNEENNTYFDKIKSEFYKQCFFITIYQYNISQESILYNSLTEYSKEMIKNIFVEMINKKTLDENTKKEIIKDYLNNGFNKDIFDKIFDINLFTNNNSFKKNKITFLTQEQCLGDTKLEIFKKRGNIATITDFAILLGGYINFIDSYHNNLLEDSASRYWTISDDKDNDVYVISESGNKEAYYVKRRHSGARPVLPYSIIHNNSSNQTREFDGILEVEYGEYPQKVASQELQDELETAYNYKESSIIKTGKNYTIDSRKWDEYNEPFKELILEEYLFSNGKRYVRVKTNSCYNYSEITLSNGKRYKNGDYVWVEVSPIKWLIDEKNDIALSEKILFAGVQFNHEKNYKGDFDRTDIKWFMDTYFVKEIIKPSIFIEQLKEQFDKTK